MKRLFIYLLLLFAIGSNLQAQWVLTNAPKNVPIYSFAYNGPNVFAGGDLTGNVATGGTVFHSINNGLDWTIIGITPDCPEIRTIALNGSNIFAGSMGGGVFLSTNMGSSWTNVSNGLTDADVYTLLMTPNGTNLYAGTIGGGMYLSTNNGGSWTNINSGLTNLEIHSLDYIQNEANDIILFAGTGGGVFLSTNDGASWTQTALNTNYVQSLAISGENIFAAAGHLFLSTDRGASWTDVTTGLSNLPVLALATYGTNVFALTDWGNMFLSTNNGADWVLINEGIIDTLVLAIGINDNYIFASGAGEGIWRRPLSELITALESSSELPNEFALYQNYPNPFNPTTNFEFRIADFGLVTLKIYDVLGNEVAVLVNEQKPAGTYKVGWNFENLSSGVYLYQLRAKDFMQTKKMILMK